MVKRSSTVVVRRRIQEEGSQSVIIDNLDGSLRKVNEQLGKSAPEHLVPVDRFHLDSVSVCQIAIARILQGLTFTQGNLDKILEGKSLETKQWQIERIFLDWPEADEEIDPMPSVAIIPSPGPVYDQQGLSVVLLDETQDVYGEDTVLQKKGTQTTEFEIVAWFAHKEERRALLRGFEDAFLGETASSQTGRRVVVPEHFDRVVRINIARANYPDNEEAKSNKRVYIGSLVCDVDVVTLVQTPATIKPRISTEIE